MQSFISKGTSWQNNLSNILCLLLRMQTEIMMKTI